MDIRRKCIALFFVAACFAAVSYAETSTASSTENEQKHKTTTVSTTSSTAATTPTTPAPSTSTSTEPSTSTPSTSTAPTTTVTSSPYPPTTSEPHTSPSTHSPAPTTAAPTVAPTTAVSTVAPTTPAPTTQGNWSVEGKNGTTCLRLLASINVTVNYQVGPTNETKEKLVHLAVPSNGAIPDGACRENETTLSLTWGSTKQFNLDWTFTKSGSAGSFVYQVTRLDFGYTLTQDVFPGALQANTTHLLTVKDPQSIIKVPLTKAWECDSEMNYALNGTKDELIIKDLKVQAFIQGKEFESLESCDTDQVSDIVPIAVGCALAGLVVLVLIAYLVNRRRNRQKGYQSV